jgi:hypothetical protein
VHRHRDLHDCVGVEWRSFFEGWNFVPYSDEDGERRLLDPDNEITSNRAMIGVWGSATVSDLYVPHGEQCFDTATAFCGPAGFRALTKISGKWVAWNYSDINGAQWYQVNAAACRNCIGTWDDEDWLLASA